MAFPEKLLNDDETVVLDLHPHWWFFAKEAAATLVMVILLVVAVVLDLNGIIQLIVLAGLVMALIALGYRLLKWRGINMVVTSERMVYRSGVVAKQGIEIPLERINTVFFNQSVMERLLGLGDLSVESAGEGGRQNFDNVWRPNRVQQIIYQAKEANEDSHYEAIAEAATAAAREQFAEQFSNAPRPVDTTMPPPAAMQQPNASATPPQPQTAGPQSGASIPEQIDQLDQLRVRGVITDAEFEAKKTELLRRM